MVLAAPACCPSINEAESNSAEIHELDGVVEQFRAEAVTTIRRTLDVGFDRREVSLAKACQRWTKCFLIAELRAAGGSQAAAFVNRLSQAYDTDDLLLDSLASQLVGQPVARWEDSSIAAFERALSEIVRSVEEESVRLAVAGRSNPNPVVVSNLSRLIEARIRGLYESLGTLIGESKARDALHRVAPLTKDEESNGDSSRSA
jgi:hypothetical protein